MAEPLFPSINRTIARIKRHPQLFWTIFVAITITVAFIFIAQMFMGIAQDAQERLVNVRIGSIQDSLSEFVDLESDSREKLENSIANLMIQNPTIQDFTFYKKENDQLTIFASSDKSSVGKSFTPESPAATLALTDSKNSYTYEVSSETERSYQTFRALVRDGQVVGLVETTQSLSQIDQTIAENIRRGMVIFILILLLVMFLFFRHSRIIDYTTLYEELRKVDQLKDDFISMASHELKTPLAAIRGYSEFITESDEVPKEYRQYSQRIDESSRQLAFLVEDMLDVARIEQGRMSFKEERILIPDFIKKLAADFDSLATAKGLKFGVEQSGLKYSYVMADEGRMRQVMMNIVGNAIKYTKVGEIKVKLSNIGENIEIRIVDTGIGMSEEERSRLFQKFYRVKNEDTKEVAGTGLGLWITKQMVEKMGGALSVESIRGVGTHMILVMKGSV